MATIASGARSELLEPARIKSIFHPSDFSETSEVAFAHALKIALVTQAKLTLLHVQETSCPDWRDFPGVRSTLARWGLIPEESARSAVEQLGIEVTKVVAAYKDPVKACLRFLQTNSADLVVLAVRQQQGRMRWLEKSVGRRIARGAGQITLFIPQGVSGFVSRSDGSIWLRNILVPITAEPSPEPAIEASARLIRNLQLPPGDVTLLHVGQAGEMPQVHVLEEKGWLWSSVTIPGNPAETILDTAIKTRADLIVMATRGAGGFLDALRGSTSELVLERTRCPVASLPQGSLLG